MSYFLGEIFDSMKNVLAHFDSSPEYNKEDGEKCKEFMQEQKPAEIKHEWNEGDKSLPEGWKMRVSEGNLQQNFLQFLAPYFCFF